MSEVLISTTDNPWNPFTQYHDWHYWDTAVLGHCSEERLASIAYFSDAMTEEESDRENERAIDEMIRRDPLGIFIKVTPNDYK